jgi:hypothetical protein
LLSGICTACRRVACTMFLSCFTNCPERLLQRDFQRATEIVNQTNDTAAAYHIAMQLEAHGEITQVRAHACSGSAPLRMLSHCLGDELLCTKRLLQTRDSNRSSECPGQRTYGLCLEISKQSDGTSLVRAPALELVRRPCTAGLRIVL